MEELGIIDNISYEEYFSHRLGFSAGRRQNIDWITRGRRGGQPGLLLPWNQWRLSISL